MPTYPVIDHCHVNGKDYAPGQTTDEIDAKRGEWLARNGYVQIEGITPPPHVAVQVRRPPPRRCCGG